MDETLAAEIGDEAAGLMYLENVYAKGYDGYLGRVFAAGMSAQRCAVLNAETRLRHPSMFGKVAA